MALAVAGGMAGGYAWTPRAVGAVLGGILGYILVETLDRLFVIYGDRERLDRELAKGCQREQERKKK